MPGVGDILDTTVREKIGRAKREHPKVWRLIEVRRSCCPAGWIEIEHVPGHATEDMVTQVRAVKEHRIANDQADISAKKKGAACGGSPQELVERYTRKVECTRLQREMAIAVLEERCHLVSEMLRAMFVPSDGESISSVGRLGR